MENHTEEDYLMLSGIQHMAFCERQWALIHIEQRWRENVLTVEGKHVHEHVDNPFENETRGEIRTTRSAPLGFPSLTSNNITKSYLFSICFLSDISVTSLSNSVFL